MDIAAPPGIDVARVTAWLAQRCTWLVPPLAWHKLPGGHSNLTYLVRDASGRSFVVRRPPMGELLPSAHDMGREFTIISGLHGTKVPVPEPLGFCDDQSVTGAVFYAMGKVDGRSLYTLDDVESLVPEALRRDLGFSFIDVLAELHAIDPADAGLADLGRPDAYVARQLKRWYGSWCASKTAEDSRVDDLHGLLSANIPQQGPGRIVHGDYGLHNCISNVVDGRAAIAAVVDWEISTLGDPLADLAYALNGWVTSEPSSAPGFPSRDELRDRYALRTGVDLSQLEFYVAFNHWKTACILEGVLARYLAGQKSTEGIDLDGIRTRRNNAVVNAQSAAASLR